MSLHRLPPRQFDFRRFWHEQFCKLRNDRGIAAALDRLTLRWIEKAQKESRLNAYRDTELAADELELEKHAARVRVKDLRWLRFKFTGVELYPLSLAIARRLHPEMEFDVLICDDSAVVANVDRTLVFDLLNGDRLSAGGSLVFVEDERFEGTPSQQLEADRLIDAQIQRDLKDLVAEESEWD